MFIASQASKYFYNFGECWVKLLGRLPFYRASYCCNIPKCMVYLQGVIQAECLHHSLGHKTLFVRTFSAEQTLARAALGT